MTARHTLSSLILGCLLLTLSATTASAGGYTNKQVTTLAKRLANDFGIPSDKQADLWKRLDKALNKPEFKAERAKQGIQGVFAYKRAGGGFIYKIVKGEGLVSFVNGPKKQKLKLRSSSLGANIGGDKEVGIGLILALKNPNHFGGKYEGKSRGVAAANASMVITDTWLLSPDKPKQSHRVYLVGLSVGLSADASKASMEITLL